MVTGLLAAVGLLCGLATSGGLRGGRGIGFLPMLLVLPACFDVQQVNPGDGSFAIDDFEDGDAVPSTSLFNRWQCTTFNPDLGQDPEQTVHCDLERQPGDQSAYALSAAFTLHDGTPGAVQYAGTTLFTVARLSPVDFNGYHALTFKLRVELSDPPPPLAQVDVELGCNTVLGTDANRAQLYFDVIQNIAASSSWQAFSLILSNFTQRPDEKNHFAEGPTSCLALVDSIRFEVNGAFMDGQAASGVIHVDDVRLELERLQ